TTSEFAQNASLLWILVLGIGLYQIANAFALKGMYFNLPQIYIGPKILYSILFLLSAIVLVPRHGVAGMAWSWVFSSFIYVALVMQANRKCRWQQPMPGDGGAMHAIETA